VNCAAVPADLLESELFGYEPGAFTGATHSKPGKFELCNKGTILLDEIGEMPVQLQAKLLHVLQDQQFSRLGSRSIIKVDVRILAATNIDIPRAIAEKKLREDLYYRLNGFTITLPPLRERKEEISILLRHMISQIGESYGKPTMTIPPRLLDACERYPWPGNLRELGNFVKRFLILGDEDMAIQELQVGVGTAMGSTSLPSSASSEGGLKGLVRGVKDEAEIEAITKALEQTNWNRKKAATILKISYKALLYKIRQYDIQPTSSTMTN
jgi:two-component system response regulator AtoC